ncbi:ROK family transcriptional regulator [Absiella sp. AM29-15]|uniref:ROK family transcriptional regulator n=1 Tax=Absiella sp. AM29-15 TaxID=2292278 RepID=UPI000E405E8E|nr:ROK family transcriptional regulator [Absiella sp. AM29-15]RGC53788.1 ROK family transcriptional regulator [Absiella sp. AM29-15]
MPVNNTFVREMNEHTILEMIILHNEISRADLSKLSGLTKSTVTEITKRLLDKALIIETRSGDSSTLGGRKPIYLRLNPYHAAVLSLDLECDGINAVAALLNGNIVKSYNKKIEINKANAMVEINNAVESLTKQIPFTVEGICSMTIAIHGIVRTDCIEFTPNYDIDEFDLMNQVQNEYEFPVFFANEANLAALAEFSTSENYDHKTLASVSIHRGVGAGIILNNSIYEGSNGFGGEFGHNILYPNGLPCSCGNHGCVERYCSVDALIHAYEIETDKRGLTLQDLSKSYYAGNKSAVKVITKYCNDLSIVINNIYTSIDPDIIILNGPIFFEFPHIIHIIKSNLCERISKNINIQMSQLKEKSILLGGAVNSIMNYLDISNFHLIAK